MPMNPGGGMAPGPGAGPICRMKGGMTVARSGAPPTFRFERLGMRPGGKGFGFLLFGF